jgi:DNA-directed RNA polymerase subunit RPC12/RpoP
MIEIWTKVKSTEAVPTAWKYKCVICGEVIDITQDLVDSKSTFIDCPVCKAWAEWGPTKPEDDVWEFLG